MLKTRVKKLFNNCVSLRDYVVQEAIDKNESVLIALGEETMFLSVEDLKNGKANGMEIRSRWDNKTYDLVDFKWSSDNLRLL